jgi:hypothetical protein
MDIVAGIVNKMAISRTKLAEQRHRRVRAERRDDTARRTGAGLFIDASLE